jgi:hypothetical protein
MQRILDLPFFRRPLFELLGFDLRRSTVDLEYSGCGWAEPERLWLQGDVVVEEVRAPLLLALHSGPPHPAVPDDLTLELPVGDGGPAAAVPLALFLDRWAPRLPGSGPVVLALCNPQGLTVQVPARLRHRPVYYAMGDVDSWLDAASEQTGALRGDDELAAGGVFRLQATAWRRAARPHPRDPVAQRVAPRPEAV